MHPFLNRSVKQINRNVEQESPSRFGTRKSLHKEGVKYTKDTII